MQNGVQPTLKTSRRISRLPWLLFLTGISLVPIGLAIWTSMTGVSWWLSPVRADADRLFRGFLIAAFAVCGVAPLFARITWRRRFLFCLLAAAAVYVTYLICGIAHLLLYGV